MRVIIAAIHGILTKQTDASWPDHFAAWCYERDPEVHVTRKEYAAGPFPRFNVWLKDPWLARGLASELELFLRPAVGRTSRLAAFEPPPVWLVAHSNGAVIALLTARRLIERGYKLGGLVLTGAACESDVERNGVATWIEERRIKAAFAYSSHEDKLLGLGKWIRPYGNLGRTGWTLAEHPWQEAAIFTRWYEGEHGGHSCYFKGQQRERTFETIYRDIESFTLTTKNAESTKKGNR